jgi:ribose transport system permease protein
MTAGTGLEMDVIAAVIIGGTSLKGGRGTIVGSLIGAAIMGILRNGFILLGFSYEAQIISIGVVIILAVTIDSLRTSG